MHEPGSTPFHPSVPQTGVVFTCAILSMFFETPVEIVNHFVDEDHTRADARVVGGTKRPEFCASAKAPDIISACPDNIFSMCEDAYGRRCSDRFGTNSPVHVQCSCGGCGAVRKFKVPRPPARGASGRGSERESFAKPPTSPASSPLAVMCEQRCCVIRA